MNTPLPLEPSAGHAGLSVAFPSTPLLERATEAAGALARRGTDALRDASQQLRDTAGRTSDNTVRLVRKEPVRALLIAAATGAALMALVGWLTRSRARA